MYSTIGCVVERVQDAADLGFSEGCLRRSRDLTRRLGGFLLSRCLCLLRRGQRPLLRLLRLRKGQLALRKLLLQRRHFPCRNVCCVRPLVAQLQCIIAQYSVAQRGTVQRGTIVQRILHTLV